MVLLVVPGGAERQVEPAVRRVVDGDRLGRQHRRVPVGHAGDEQAEPDARRHAGQCGQRRHALERLARPLAVHRLEVVEAPHAVEAQLLRELHPADELVPRHALLRHIESESHGAHVTTIGAELTPESRSHGRTEHAECTGHDGPRDDHVRGPAGGRRRRGGRAHARGVPGRGRRPVRTERGRRARRPAARRRDRAVDLRAPRDRGAPHRAGAARRRGRARRCGGRAHGQPPRGRGRHLRCRAGRRRRRAHVDLLAPPRAGPAGGHLPGDGGAHPVPAPGPPVRRRRRRHRRGPTAPAAGGRAGRAVVGRAAGRRRRRARRPARRPRRGHRPRRPRARDLLVGHDQRPQGHPPRAPVALAAVLGAGRRVRPASRHPHVQRPAPVLDRRVQHRRRRHAGRRRLLGRPGDLRPRRPRWP